MEAVSVIIPCYNKAPYLRETIESALGQTLPPEEVIVIDDGSTDDSAAIAASYGPPVRVLRQENRGESVARNRGIEEAEGNWIALLDADDRWKPEKLERQREEIRAHAAAEELVCVYSDVYLFRDGERIGEHRKPEYHAREDYRVQMLCDWSINSSSVLLRADVLERVRFPEEVRHSEDMIFFLELRERGTFVRIPECLVGYRRTEANQSATPRHKMRSVRARFEWFLRNRDRFTAEERKIVRESLADQLRYPHDVALGPAHDVTLARECRSLYARIHPDPDPRPESFRRRLYPRPLYLLKDQLSALLRPSAE